MLRKRKHDNYVAKAASLPVREITMNICVADEAIEYNFTQII